MHFAAPVINRKNLTLAYGRFNHGPLACNLKITLKFFYNLYIGKRLFLELNKHLDFIYSKSKKNNNNNFIVTINYGIKIIVAVFENIKTTDLICLLIYFYLCSFDAERQL